MSTIQSLRQQYPEFDEYGYTDKEVVEWMAGQTGMDTMQVAEYYGLYDPDQGDFSRGVGNAFRSTKALAGGLVGLAGDTLERNIGVGEGLRDYGIGVYRNQMDNVALRSKETDNFENLNSVGDYADFAQYYSGYGLAQAAEAVGTGGLGSLVGKQVAKQGIKSAGKDLLSDAAQAQVAKAGARGFTAGVGAQAVGTELGATYGGAVDRVTEEGGDLSDIELGPVYGYGTAAGLLESAADVATLGLARLGPGKAAFDMLKNSNRATRAATRGAAGAVTEGITEGIQTGLEDLGAGYSMDEAGFFDPTAVAAGAIGGGQLGVAGGVLTRAQNSQTELDVERAQQEATRRNEERAAQLAQEQEQAVQAEQDVAAIKAARREAAKDFTPRKKFEATRKKELEADFRQQVEDPTSDLGRQFQTILDESEAYDPDDVKAETDKFIKQVVKDAQADIDLQIREEYNAALDQRVAELQNQPAQETTTEETVAPEEPAVEAPTINGQVVTPETKVRGRTQAQTKADALLPENWIETEQYADVASALNATKFNNKKFENALGTVLNAQATEQAGGAVAVFQQQTPKGLAKFEGEVFNHIKKAFVDGDPDTVFAGGKWRTSDIADALGVEGKTDKARTAKVSTALNRVMKKVAKNFGMTQEEAQAQLAETRLRPESEADAAQEAARGVVDGAEIADMSTQASVGQGNTQLSENETMSEEEVAFVNEKAATEPDEWKEVRDERAKAEALGAKVAMVRTHGRNAIQMWRNGVSQGGPRMDQLKAGDLHEWVAAVAEHAEGLITYDDLMNDLRDIENRYDQDNAGPALEVNQPTVEVEDGPVIEGTATEVDNTGNDTVATETEGSGDTTEQGGGADTGTSGQTAAVRVEKKPAKKAIVGKKDAPKFSIPTDPNAAEEQAAKRQAFEQVIVDLTGETTNRNVVIYDNLTQAALDGRLRESTIKKMSSNGAAAVVERPSASGDPKAYFLLDRIPAGGERAIFMHEVGGHIGIDEVLSEQQQVTIANQIFEWAGLKDDSLQSRIAQYTIANATFANENGGIAEGNQRSEVIAYFLQAATEFGVQPSTKSAVGRLVRSLYAAFKRAVRKLNMFNAELTPTDIVDVAWGAGRIGLSSRKHGTGADFRRFDHRYMSTGEGAQAFGFGTYLADRFGIARSYLREMERRKRQTLKKEMGDFSPDQRIPVRVADLSGDMQKAIERMVRMKDRVRYRGYDDEVMDAEKARRYGIPRIHDMLDEDGFFMLGEKGDPQIWVPKLGWNRGASQLYLKSLTGRTGLGYTVIELDRLVTPTKGYESTPFFSSTSRDILVREIKDKQYPINAEGTFMRVDTTVPDSEMLNWDANIGEKDGKKDFDTILGGMSEADQLQLWNTLVQKHEWYLVGRDDVDMSNPVDQFRELAPVIRMGEVYNALHELQMSDGNFLGGYLPDETLDNLEAFNSHRLKSQAATSAFLDQLGIKGIKYRDNVSRGDTADPTFNRVVFDDKNLIVVSRTRGKAVKDRSSKITEAKFSINKDTVEAIAGEKGAQAFDDAKNLTMRAANSIKFVHQLVRDVRKEMPAAQEWLDARRKADAAKTEIKSIVEAVAVQARRLAPERLREVNNFIADSTLSQKWGYDPQWSYRKIVVDPATEKRFKALNPDEQQIVKSVFLHGETMRLRKQQIAKEQGVKDDFFTAAAMEGPYAPMKRFGNYASVLKSQQLLDAEEAQRDSSTEKRRKELEKMYADESHYVVKFFDTMGQAKKHMRQNEGSYASAEAVRRRPDMYQGRITNTDVLEKVMANLNADDMSGLDSNAKTAFGNMVRQLYFESMDERDARNSAQRRRGVAGFEENMIRSFLSHATVEASMIANMENGAEINAAFINMQKQAKGEKLSEAFDTLSKHYTDTLSYNATPIQDRIAAINSVYMLTTSFGYHFANFTQPTMVSIPRLAGDFNDYKGSWAALMKAYKFSIKAAQMTRAGETNIDVTGEAIPRKYHEVLENLQMQGLLDVGMEEDLSSFDRFNTGYNHVDRASDALGGVVHKLYQVSRWVEAQNRISAAIAAYDMAEANPDKLKAMGLTREQYVTEVVEDTQGNFSRADAPLAIKKLGPVITQYRKYQLLMAWMYGDAVKRSYSGESPEIKWMARRTLAYALGHAALFGGLTGVPLATTIVPWMLAFSNEGDEPEDMERAIRRNVDGPMADVLTRGAFSLLGIDLSTKLSQGKIFHPFPYVDYEVSEDGTKDLFFNALAGPSGTTALNFAKSYQQWKKGDVLKGVEYMVPKGLRTIVESYRLGTEGYTTGGGELLADPLRFDMYSLLVNATGIPSTQVNQVKWTRGQQYELEEWFGKKSSELRRDYIKAQKNKDQAGMREAREEWRELQNAKDRVRPFFNDAKSALKRQPVSTLLRSPRDRARREERNMEKLGN